MSRHENQNKKRKKWRYVYGKLGITQRFNIEDTKERSQIDEVRSQKDGSGKRYTWKDIMKQSHFIFRI